MIWLEIALLAVAFFYWKSNRLLNESYSAAQVAVDLPPPDSTSLARGRHLAITQGCTDCHGPDLAGTPMMDAMPVAFIPSSNLTAAGVGASYSDADWIRAIRHGVGPDGKSLWLMPSAAYTHLSPEDLSALIAFLKTAEPVDRVFPPKQFGPIGRMLVANGSFKLSEKLPALRTRSSNSSVSRYRCSSYHVRFHGLHLKASPWFMEKEGEGPALTQEW